MKKWNLDWVGKGGQRRMTFSSLYHFKKIVGAKSSNMLCFGNVGHIRDLRIIFVLCKSDGTFLVYIVFQSAKSEQTWHPPLQYTDINPNLQSTENASQSARKCKKKNEVRVGRWCTTQGFALKKCTYIREWCSAAAVIYPSL